MTKCCSALPGEQNAASTSEITRAEICRQKRAARKPPYRELRHLCATGRLHLCTQLMKPRALEENIVMGDDICNGAAKPVTNIVVENALFVNRRCHSGRFDYHDREVALPAFTIE